MTLARFVLLEARRSGLPFLVLAALVGGFGIAGFLTQVALIESANLQMGIFAICFRLIAIALTVSFVVTSMVRESSDKGLELLLSLPISRSTYYLGKLAGYVACSVLISAVFSFAMLLGSPHLKAAAWGVSLVLEASTMAAVSFFFVIALGKVLPAIMGVAGSYFLARVIGTLQSISSGPLTDEKNLLTLLSRWSLDAVAFALPPMDKVTKTDWLLYTPPTTGEFLALLGSLLIYGALVVAAGLFDFHRRNL